MPAGAPKKPPELVKVPVGLKLPRYLIAWMRAQDKSMAAVVETAICEHYKVKRPDSGS